MTWLQRYRIRHYLQNSIWVYPVLAMITAVALVRLLHWFEVGMGWASDLNPDTMRTVLGNLAGAMFTFIVFVCSSLLLVVQMASAQLTPRIIGVMFKDPIAKITLSMFVFTFALTISALIRIGTAVPVLTAEIAAYSFAACLAMFLFLIDRVGKMLRPSGALRSVAMQAHDVIDQVYPRRFQENLPAPGTLIAPNEQPSRVVLCQREGVVLAFDVKGLVVLAARHHCLIELVPQVGEFVAPGNPLYRIFTALGAGLTTPPAGGGVGDPRPAGDIPAKVLYQSIAFGEERTVEQDPAFAFRVIVDIASKGLSLAINDPTTAVLAIDQLHHLLRHVGRRRLDNEQVVDGTGRVRLIYRTPDWEDFVTLAVTEIRQFGRTSIQIARRLRAMLEDLLETLPEERAPSLRHELKLLHQSTQRDFVEPEDRTLAEISDSQGVGGSRVLYPSSRRGDKKRSDSPPA